MRKLNSKHVAIVAALCLVSSSALAGGRPDGSSRDWFGFISGGYAFADGKLGDIVDDDWTIGGGAMYWPSEWPVGISIEAAWVDFDFSNAALNALNDAIDADPNNSGSVTGGGAQTWQLGVNGTWSLGEASANGFYLTGGVGWYHVDASLTQDGLVYYPPVCSPWYWWCLPGGVGPGTFLVGSETSDNFGWNLGLGYSFRTSSGQVFVEAKYVQIQTSNENSEYIPLTIGFRWQANA